jgi:quercetin dioxygenase-like cupin family protein
MPERKGNVMEPEEKERAANALAAQVLDPAALAGYQDGSVVSRELVRGKTGTVTVFAFDQGQGLSEHTAPFDALVHVIDGSAEITIEGTFYRVGRGEIIIMPAGRPHALFAAEPFKMVLVMIRS